MNNIANSNVIESFHGTSVSDPYRWLEDRQSIRTAEWIADQRRRFGAYFERFDFIPQLKSYVAEHLVQNTYARPVRVASHYFCLHRDSREEQSSIWAVSSLGQLEQRLVNPAAKGRFFSVDIYSLSADGSLLAYTERVGGTANRGVRIVETHSGAEWWKGLSPGKPMGMLFLPNKRGVLYCHELVGTKAPHCVHIHLFGQGTREDSVVFQVPRTPRSSIVLFGDGERCACNVTYEVRGQLVTSCYVSTFRNLTQWVRVVAERPSPFSPFLWKERLFAFTTADAPSGRIVELDSNGAVARVIVPEAANLIRQFVIAGDILCVSYRSAREPGIWLWTSTGERVGRIDVPLHCSVRMITSVCGNTESMFYSRESFTEVPQLFEFSSDSRRSAEWPSLSDIHPKLPFSTDTLLYTSNDGTEVPMYFVTSSAHSFSVGNPVLMTSYGGFGVSVTPQYSVLLTVLLKLGVSVALPCIRGGADLGRGWYDAGRRTNRQVAIADFIAAAESLSVGTPFGVRPIAVLGGSNSGLLVAAAMTQRPDLFRVVLCIAPLLDMVRYETFDNATNWREEYGTVSEPDEFQALYAYSPYHHVDERVDYPGMMFVTGDKDDRCNPAHVRKMVARLQGRFAQIHPVIVDYSEERGHAPVMPLSTRIDALTHRIAFLCNELGVDVRGDLVCQY